MIVGCNFISPTRGRDISKTINQFEFVIQIRVPRYWLADVPPTTYNGRFTGPKRTSGEPSEQRLDVDGRSLVADAIVIISQVVRARTPPGRTSLAMVANRWTARMSR